MAMKATVSQRFLSGQEILAEARAAADAFYAKRVTQYVHGVAVYESFTLAKKYFLTNTKIKSATTLF